LSALEAVIETQGGVKDAKINFDMVVAVEL
jgi:hypothetical protein